MLPHLTMFIVSTLSLSALQFQEHKLTDDGSSKHWSFMFSEMQLWIHKVLISILKQDFNRNVHQGSTPIIFWSIIKVFSVVF